MLNYLSNIPLGHDTIRRSPKTGCGRREGPHPVFGKSFDFLEAMILDLIRTTLIQIDAEETRRCHDGTKRTTNFRDGKAKNMSVSDLTPREMEILQLLIAGYTNKAIAHEIHISRKTVEFHLDHIYTKIGARTRLMAGVWAVRHGILAETREIPS